jgi:hypothetical protein
MKPLTPPNNIQLSDYRRYGNNNGHFDSPLHHGNGVVIVHIVRTNFVEMYTDRPPGKTTGGRSAYKSLSCSYIIKTIMLQKLKFTVNNIHALIDVCLIVVRDSW